MRSCVACAALLFGTTLSAQSTPPLLSDADRILGLSQLWQEVNRSFVFKDRLGFSVDSLYLATLPKVIAAKDLYDYYRELQRFTGALRDGHTGVSFPNALSNERTYPWLTTRWIDGHLMINNSGKSLAKAFPFGTEITTIDGRPAREYLEAEVLPFTTSSTDHFRWAWGAREALYGRASKPVRIQYERPDGTRGDTTLARDRRTRDDAWLSPTEQPRFAWKWLSDSIAYVALRSFADNGIKDDFAAIIPTLRRARGLVIDVRGNTGGNSGNGWDILAHMVKDSLPLQVWRTRIHNAAYKGWGRSGFANDSAFTPFDSGNVYPPYADPLLVPTVILQDNETFSAAEDFLVAADEIPRILTMGQVSGGSTGNPIFWQLPGGGFARVVSKHDRYRDGREFVGRGVRPRATLAPPTLADVRAGRDPVLTAAVAAVKRQSPT